MTRITTLLIALTLQGCGFSNTSCEYDSERVEFARSLSQDRLDTLYHDSKRLLGSNPNVHIAPVPNEFSDLNPIDLRRWGSKTLGIKLEGCFDHFVFLNVDTESGLITVQFGEGPTAGEETLWNDDV